MKTLRIEDPKASPFARLKAGDTVVVHTKDGKTDRFVVAAVHEDALVSVNGGRYQSDEIAKIERKSISVPRTVGLSIAVYLGVGLVAFAIAFASAFGG
jgi:3-dehydroquinate synthase class II